MFYLIAGGAVLLLFVLSKKGSVPSASQSIGNSSMDAFGGTTAEQGKFYDPGEVMKSDFPMLVDRIPQDQATEKVGVSGMSTADLLANLVKSNSKVDQYGNSIAIYPENASSANTKN